MSAPISFPLNEQQIRRAALVQAAKIVVEETADFAAGHSSTCQDCERTCNELGEAIRKKLMEVGE